MVWRGSPDETWPLANAILLVIVSQRSYSDGLFAMFSIAGESGTLQSTLQGFDTIGKDTWRLAYLHGSTILRSLILDFCMYYRLSSQLPYGL